MKKNNHKSNVATNDEVVYEAWCNHCGGYHYVGTCRYYEGFADEETSDTNAGNYNALQLEEERLEKMYPAATTSEEAWFWFQTDAGNTCCVCGEECNAVPSNYIDGNLYCELCV